MWETLKQSHVFVAALLVMSVSGFMQFVANPPPNQQQPADSKRSGAITGSYKTPFSNNNAPAQQAPVVNQPAGSLPQTPAQTPAADDMPKKPVILEMKNENDVQFEFVKPTQKSKKSNF